MDEDWNQILPQKASSPAFVCSVPNCGRSFQRKEHLNRHQRSHRPFRPHRCYICSRSFARSDVLNRHVLLHNVPPEGAKRTLLACQTCRRRKTKCDSNEPCSTCFNMGIECVRRPSSMQATARIDLTPIGDAPDHSIDIRSEDMDGTLLGLISQDGLSSISPDDKDLPSLADYDMSWIAGTPALFSDTTPFDDLSLPSDLESLESVSILTRSREDQRADLFMESTPDPSLDTSFQASTDDLHKLWPYLHRSTIETTSPSALLSQSLHKTYGDLRCNSHLIEFTSRLLLPQCNADRSPSISLLDLQILAAVITSTITREMAADVVHWAIQWTEIAISAIRGLGMLIGQGEPGGVSPGEHECWVQKEESKRLVYTMLRVDAYLSLITGRPPSLRVQEFQLPLPVTDNLWTASTAESRQQLSWFEPAGRTRATLSGIVRDGLLRFRTDHAAIGMPPLLPADSHLVLCTLQGEIWGAAQEAQNLNHDLSSTNPSWRVPESVTFWHRYLVEWQAQHSRFSPCMTTPLDESIWNTLNTTQYHLCQLTIHAPLQVLESRQCCTRSRMFNTTAMLRCWASSIEGRRAVYHAAQLQRLHEEQSGQEQSGHNPLQAPALLASAVVLCSYAVDNNPGHAADPIEMCQTELSSAPCPIDQWIEHGGPSMVSGVKLSASNLSELFAWIQERMGKYPGSLARVERLTEMLA